MEKNKIMISAVLFVFWPDEANYIEACLQTLDWADEIIVIENSANDETIKVVKKYTQKVYKSKSNSFAERHNLGKELSKGDWIFYIDADERVSRSLSAEIKNSINGSLDAYEVRRVNFFLAKEVRYGDRYPDYVVRLFRKSKLVSWTGIIHESSNVDGKIGRLSNPFFHLTHRNIFSMLEKTINFSEHEAQLRLKANHPPVVWWRLPRVFITELWTRMVKYQGFRQGTEGWIDGFFQALSMFIVYARLWELQRKPSLDETLNEIDKKIVEGKL